MKKITGKILTFITIPMSFVMNDRQVQAQISSDGTLPTNVRQAGSAVEITGGAQAGNNLFHSFGEFSVPRGGEAFFKNANNASNVANIIGRVTGGSISNIDGLIRENYGANVILINPSGINFGPNARLQIGGSFLASTADNLKFADGTVFSATNPQSEPLLTVSVPVGLQFGQNPAPIQVQGSGSGVSVREPIFSPVTRNSNPSGLQVSPGKTLALVGGDIDINGGSLIAEGGRIELGSVAQGLVSLNTVAQGWTLDYRGVSNYKDIEMRSQALVDASSTQQLAGGSIRIQGHNLSIRDGSLVLIQNQGTQPAGGIDVRASESVSISGTNTDGTLRSSLTNETVGAGTGGNIDLSSKRLFVSEGATIVAKTFSPSTGGNIRINTSNSLHVTGASAIDPNATSSIVAATFGDGNSGHNSVSARRLRTTRGGTIASATFGEGRGGNLNVKATDEIEIVGGQINSLLPSGLVASAFDGGDAGNLTIDTSRLFVRDGGGIIAVTLASGAAGDIKIAASELVEVTGEAPRAIASSSISSSAIKVNLGIQRLFGLPPVPSGNAGNVTINSEQVNLSRGAQISAENQGQGDAGSVNINAGSIFLNDRAGITAETSIGGGRGGSIVLKARNSIEARKDSRISNINGGDRAAGDLTLETGRLSFSDGAFAATTTLGRGAGGNLIVRASESVEVAGDGFEAYQRLIGEFFEGTNSVSNIRNGLFTGTNAVGAAGNLSIETQQLRLREGAFISTSTFGAGRGGNITIKADRGTDLSSSGLASTTITDASAGNVTLDTSNLIIREGGAIVTATLGRGAGGDLSINASESVRLSNTPVGAITPTGMFTNSIGSTGKAGNLTINTQRLVVRDGSGISTQSGLLTDNNAIATGGKGGDLTINATEGIELSGVSPDNGFNSILSTSTYSSSPAGNIAINTGKLSVRDGTRIETSTFGSGSGGNLDVNATRSVEVSGVDPIQGEPSLLTVSTLNRGKAGNLTINAPRVIVRKGGRIDSSTVATGSAGNLTINSESVEVSGTVPGGSEPSQITAGANIESEELRNRLNLPDVPSGASGNVNIDTERLVVTDGAQINARNEGTGNAGTLNINARSLFLDNEGSLTAATQSGRGGNIELQVRDSLQMRRGSQISARAGGTSDGGNISINTNALLLFENSNIFANAVQGRGGRIDISTQGLFQCADCQISAASEVGLDGVVEVFTPDVETNLEVLDVPEQVTQPEDVVALACAATPRQTRSEFTITGRGGLPPRPNEALSSEALVSFGSPAAETTSTATPQAADTLELPPPARGWYVNDRGAVVLAAQAPAASPYNSRLTSQNCRSK